MTDNQEGESMGYRETGAHPVARRRLVCHFSCGTSSAVATKLALAQYRDKCETVVLRIRIASEHEDNDRFAEDCAAWFDHEITTIQSAKYADTWDVFEKTRYLVGVSGARCTTELKKRPAREFWKQGDIDIFGFHAGERDRFARFKANNPELDARAPLIEADMSKADCHALIERTGIALPTMYRLGFQNNNCIGCVKGGAGYWNMIRKHFPDTFERMAKLERELGTTILKMGRGRIFLDELGEDEGRYSEEPDIQCGLFCYANEEQLLERDAS